MTLHINDTIQPPVHYADAIRDGFKFSEHRAALRSWLKDCGNTSAEVNMATKAEFLDCLRRYGELVGERKTEQPKTEQPKTEQPKTEQPKTEQPKTETKKEPKTMDQQDQAAQLAALLSNIMSKPQFDEKAIIALIEKHSVAPSVQRYEVKGAEPVEISGAHAKLSRVVHWLGLRVPVYLYGGAGSGKTTLAKQAAQALSLPFYQYGALMTKYDVDNRTTLQGDVLKSTFYEWFTSGGVMLLDEIDSSRPEALVQWNDAIRGGEGTVATFSNGETVKKHKDAVVIVAANTVGTGANSVYVGRNKLDAATLDGFIKLEIEYDETVETTLARGHSDWLELCRTFRQASDKLQLKVIISPRAIDFGARSLSADSSTDNFKLTVKEKIRSGMDSDQWSALCREAGQHNELVTRLGLVAL